jgi:phage tail sheath protein FI
VAVLSPEKADCVNNGSYAGKETEDVIAYRDTLPSSSYAVMDSSWKYQYDKFNDVYRWVPLNGDTAGLMVQTDLTRDPWFSPAGFNRGNVKNIIKLAYNPSKADRDNLYKKGINPVVTFPGQGTVLFGDKTMLNQPSAFDRINVRRLFIVLEKAISTASKFTLFEFNDEFTRAQFKNLVEPFLRDVQGRKGITDFAVVCDGTNNTGEIIDRNEFVGDIYVKPSRSINFIQLNFVAVRTGVEFTEIVGRA